MIIGWRNKEAHPRIIPEDAVYVFVLIFILITMAVYRVISTKKNLP